MGQSVYLGIDIGTSSAKCLAVDERGAVLALTAHPYPISHPHEGWAEQDPEDYWRALVDVVSRCADGLRDKGDIVSLAMSTQGDTLILTDDDGTPLAPAFSWMDTRSGEEFKELLAERDSSFWYDHTGSSLNAFSSACTMRWLAKSEPELWGKTRRISWVADFLAKRLCGEFVTDVPSASWTPLYSPFERDWSDEVIDLLHVQRESLPDAVESGSEIGELLPEVATELHLPLGVKLIAGAFDQTAAACGAGATVGGRAVLSCGTAWVLYSVANKPVADNSGNIPICCHATPSEWGMVLPFTGGSAYDWLRRLFGDREGRGESGSNPLVFIPHLYGGLCPDWRGESKGSLLGLTLSHTWPDIELALMHGMAFEARRNLDAAERLCGRVEAIRMVGGAGKSETWPRIIANVLNRPIEVTDLVESACYGSAKIAAGDAAADWTAPGTLGHHEPSPNEVERECRQYERYLRFYEALLPIYALES